MRLSKMPSKRRIFLLICICLLVLGYAIGIGYIVNNLTPFNTAGGENTKHYVALVAKSKESNFWKTVFAGANAASTEYNLEVSVDGPQNEEDFETQNRMIEKAVEDGAEVIIFSAVDYEANAKTIDWAIAQGVRVVVIDSDVNSGGVSIRISTDNYEAGKMAGEAALESVEGNMQVGIVNFDLQARNGQEREKGFKDRMASEKRVTIVETINVISTTEEAKRGAIELMQKHPEINIIVTFNEWTTLGVGYAIEELGLKDSVEVVAFDNNEVSVGMLETGEVDALIVQNPYAMGYLSVESAYNLIFDIPLNSTVVDTETTAITKENMFKDEFQRVLFNFD